MAEAAKGCHLVGNIVYLPAALTSIWWHSDPLNIPDSSTPRKTLYIDAPGTLMIDSMCASSTEQAFGHGADVQVQVEGASGETQTKYTPTIHRDRRVAVASRLLDIRLTSARHPSKYAY